MNGYGSHLPILDLVCAHTGAVYALEYGCGLESTPWLLENCDELTSIERDPLWLDKVQGILPCTVRNRWYPVLLNDEREFQFTQAYDVCLVDGGNPLHRVDCVHACMDSLFVRVIVVHDTESHSYDWGRVKIREGWIPVDCDKYMPWTTVITRDQSLIDLLTAKFKVQ